MCRNYARNRRIHLVNHELYDPDWERPYCKRKAGKTGKKLSASRMKDLKIQHRKNRERRRDDAKTAYQKQCELEMQVAEEQRVRNAVRYKRKPKKQLLVEAPARKINLQAIAERRERAEARKEMREFKKVFHFLLRISNGDKSLFVVLLASLVNSANHQETHTIEICAFPIERMSLCDDFAMLCKMAYHTPQPHLSHTQEKALGRPRTKYIPTAGRRCSQRPRQTRS